jgi:prevent-host-death family protein
MMAMEETVSATDASRKFAQILRTVREGRTFIVTLHGKAVVKVVPMAEDHKVRLAARAILLERLRSQPVLNVGRWTRGELYEDEQ